MKVKAKISFGGEISATIGEILEIPDDSLILKDLLKAGYVKKIKEDNKMESKK